MIEIRIFKVQLTELHSHRDEYRFTGEWFSKQPVRRRQDLIQYQLFHGWSNIEQFKPVQ